MSTPEIKVFIEDGAEPTTIRNADVASRLGIQDGDRLNREKAAELLEALRAEIRIRRRRRASRVPRRPLNSIRKGAK